MPMYQLRGEVPKKRHTQLWREGQLVKEEVFGLEGFSGNSSILYHLETPGRITELGEFEQHKREEWVPEKYAHSHYRTGNIPAEGDALSGRRLLMWNSDIEIAINKHRAPMLDFYRNGEGDEVIFIHFGAGTLESIFGELPYREGDYIVIPRGVTYRFRPTGPQTHLVMTAPRSIEIPRRYRNAYGHLLENAPYYHRDIHPVSELKTHTERGEFRIKVRVRTGYQTFIQDYHPFDLIGWDGYVYPWTFNIEDFEPIAGRLHVPPTAHQTFEGHNFVICSFVPRKLDWDPQAVPLPYYHSNLNSEEVLYYVSGNYKARRGIEVGSITLHPSGLPHGPQPGAVEKALGAQETDELAVMIDTFNPLHLTPFASTISDPRYAYSWSDQPALA